MTERNSTKYFRTNILLHIILFRVDHRIILQRINRSLFHVTIFFYFSYFIAIRCLLSIFYQIDVVM